MKKLLSLITITGILFRGKVLSSSGSLEFFPDTRDNGMFCWAPLSIIAHTAGSYIQAADIKIFARSGSMQFSAVQLTLPNFVMGENDGISLVDDPNFPAGTPYKYYNIFTAFPSQSFVTTGITGQTIITMFATSSGIHLTGSLYFYNASGDQDDSQLSSGAYNRFQDALGYTNSGRYLFEVKPCFPDIDPPIITGYASGGSYNIQVTTGFTFFTYDWTGIFTDGLNSSSHYWFYQPPTSDLNNYVPVGPLDIDNQYGIDEKDIIIYASGLETYQQTGFPAFPPLLPKYISLGDIKYWYKYTTGATIPQQSTQVDEIYCEPYGSGTFTGVGYPLARNREQRGRYCTMPFSTLGLEGPQKVLIELQSRDKQTNPATGKVSFTVILTGILPHNNYAIVLWPEKRLNHAITVLSGTVPYTIVYNTLSSGDFELLMDSMVTLNPNISPMKRFLTALYIVNVTGYNLVTQELYQYYTSGFTGQEHELPDYLSPGYDPEQLIQQSLNTLPNLFTQGEIFFKNLSTSGITSIQVNETELGYKVVTGDLVTGMFDIGFKSKNHLMKIIRNVDISSNYQLLDFSSSGLDLLTVGDYTNDNMINTFDVGMFLPSVGTNTFLFDNNGDGIVNSFDLSILFGNYLLIGEVF